MASSTRHTSVLIIGAGPTGLTLALALRHRGIPYRLIECRTGPERWSRALGLQARTLEVLDRLGLAERFLAAAHPLEGAAFHLPGHLPGEEVRMHFQHVHPRFPSMVILPQYETERLLTEAGAAPELGTEFLEMQNGNALLRHQDGRLEWVAADWIAPRARFGVALTRVRWANDAYYDQPDRPAPAARSHDVSVLGTLRGGGAVGPLWLEAEWTGGRRYNFLFQNSSRDFTEQELSVSPFNQTLRLRISFVPELP